jgi:hypothetical protein
MLAAMGTWGDGIYDNDSALDRLGDLVEFAAEDVRGAAELAARIGVLAWLNPVAVGSREEALRAAVAAADVGALPAETRDALARLLADPDVETRGRSRTEAARAAIGGYCDGPRIDALLRVPGAEATLAALGERAAASVDRALKGADRPGDRRDLYEITGELAGLGVLIDLAEAGFGRPAAARVEAWTRGLAAIDRRTRDERGFWAKYIGRVRRGLELLAPPVPRSTPIVRRAPR